MEIKIVSKEKIRKKNYFPGKEFKKKRNYFNF